MTKSINNPFFPCQLVEHDEYQSVITSDFHYFDAYFGNKGGGGYSLEQLAKKLAKEHHIKDLKFDSEAGMFCAYSANRDSLLSLCKALRQITGEEEKYRTTTNQKPKISQRQAEELLLRGFVMELNADIQAKFLANVPFPPLSLMQEQCINTIQNGSEEACWAALRKINSEACSKTRNFNHYLSHPQINTLLFELLDKKPTEKIQLEALRVLQTVCNRHLPDLRCRHYFYEALTHKKADMRQCGVYGLAVLYDYDVEKIKSLLNDKSEKVREAAKRELKFGLKKDKNYDDIFAVWMFDAKMVKKVKETIENV